MACIGVLWVPTLFVDDWAFTVEEEPRLDGACFSVRFPLTASDIKNRAARSGVLASKAANELAVCVKDNVLVGRLAGVF